MSPENLRQRIANAISLGWTMWHVDANEDGPAESFSTKPGQKYIEQRIRGAKPGVGDFNTHPFLGEDRLPPLRIEDL